MNEQYVLVVSFDDIDFNDYLVDYGYDEDHDSWYAIYDLGAYYQPELEL